MFGLLATTGENHKVDASARHRTLHCSTLFAASSSSSFRVSIFDGSPWEVVPEDLWAWFHLQNTQVARMWELYKLNLGVLMETNSFPKPILPGTGTGTQDASFSGVSPLRMGTSKKSHWLPPARTRVMLGGNVCLEQNWPHLVSRKSHCWKPAHETAHLRSQNLCQSTPPRSPAPIWEAPVPLGVSSWLPQLFLLPPALWLLAAVKARTSLSHAARKR